MVEARRYRMLLGVFTVAAALVVAAPAGGATLVVTNANPSGAGSLTQAIIDAKNETTNPGADIVDIQYVGTIPVPAELPSISSPMTIQGPSADKTTLRLDAEAYLFSIDSTTTIKGLTLTSTVDTGSAIFAPETELTLDHVRITGFTNTGTPGVLAGYGKLTIDHSTVDHNTLDAGGNPILGVAGGGVSNFLGTLDIRNSTISDNRVTNAAASGNSTISGNVLAIGGSLSVDSSTIASGRGQAGTLAAGNLVVLSEGKVTLHNSVLADAGDLPNCALAMDTTGGSAGFNIADDASCGLGAAGDQPSTDPQLGPLGFVAGEPPTTARPLRATSPAIDAGQATAALGATDQAGLVRTFDQPSRANAAGGDGTDVGAVETALLPTPPANPPGNGGGGGPAKDVVAPGVTGAKLSRTSFRVGPGRTALSAAAGTGTTVRFSLSEAATAKLVVVRERAGRKKGKSCSTKRKKGKRCTQLTTVGTLTRTGKAGANSVAFSGRLGRKALAAGRYRFVIAATDAAGNTSAKRTLKFRVLKAAKTRTRR